MRAEDVFKIDSVSEFIEDPNYHLLSREWTSVGDEQVVKESIKLLGSQIPGSVEMYGTDNSTTSVRQ